MGRWVCFLRGVKPSLPRCKPDILTCHRDWTPKKLLCPVFSHLGGSRVCVRACACACVRACACACACACVCVCVCFEGHTHGIWRFPDDGSNRRL